MFTKEINGKVYGLIKVPDHSNAVTVTRDAEPGYVWISNAAGISKRVRSSLDDWEVVCMMNIIPDKIAYPIGLMTLAMFLIEAGLKDH